MPHVKTIRVLRYGPGKQHGLKAAFVDEFVDKGRPFYGAHPHLYTQRFELVLDNYRGLYALVLP